MSYKQKIKHAVFQFSTTPITRELISECEKRIAAAKSNPKKYDAVPAKMREFQKTYSALLRLHGRKSAVAAAEILALLGMFTAWHVNRELYQDICYYIYSLMIAGGLYIAAAGDELDKLQELLWWQITTLDKAAGR